MAQGKKYDDKIKEQVRTALSINNNTLEVSRKFHIPKTTIQTWKKQWENEEGEESLGKLRAIRKQEFIDLAWETAQLGVKIAHEGMQKLDTSKMKSKDIEQVVSASHKLQQMSALENGDATENINVTGINFGAIEE